MLIFCIYISYGPNVLCQQLLLLHCTWFHVWGRHPQVAQIVEDFSSLFLHASLIWCKRHTMQKFQVKHYIRASLESKKETSQKIVLTKSQKSCWGCHLSEEKTFTLKASLFFLIGCKKIGLCKTGSCSFLSSFLKICSKI